ncbi:MAG: glycosyltransferase [Gammaproteobacteria bacterium]
MVIILYAAKNAKNIEQMLGMPDYSYYFVLKEFRPVLERLGEVIIIDDPLTEVDAIYAACCKRNEACVFLSFTPPHDTLIDLACPTIPVFAWEFYDIPNETWDKEVRNDWRMVLDKLGCAITHSTFAVNTVHKSLGTEFPVASIPAPVWDRFARPGDNQTAAPVQPHFAIHWRGRKIDSLDITPLSENAAEQAESLSVSISIDLAPEPAPIAQNETKSRQSTDISGVVYTSIFNPNDGRKNWLDMPRTFCYALRDCEDAVLVLKLTHAGLFHSYWDIQNELRRLMPFKCRVVVIDGFLADADYEKLLLNSSYAVNTSLGEGQCLPLMEYMSCGKPAITPDHTGMADYVNSSNGFLVNSSLEPCSWPQDPRAMYRTRRHRIDAQSLMDAFQESYRTAKQDRDRYRLMSTQARENLRQHCSAAVLENRLRDFLQTRLAQTSINKTTE